MASVYCFPFLYEIIGMGIIPLVLFFHLMSWFWIYLAGKFWYTVYAHRLELLMAQRSNEDELTTPAKKPEPSNMYRHF
uniref:Uncharacterized protein n=1 Tax=Acartia pacifica TaxID=335913 RepID=A0A0U2TK06_ACAPC|nr:hypothetical protein [Acartia pacifica]